MLQLEGGIHKYMERFPDGHFRGKLFVFDDRYAIQSNDDVVSSKSLAFLLQFFKYLFILVLVYSTECFYCSSSWDSYQPCTSAHCHQLVLSCPQCRQRRLTACCSRCQQNSDTGSVREECDCTLQRPRIPVERKPHCSPNKTGNTTLTSNSAN